MRRILKSTLLSAAAALPLSMASYAALAQDQDDDAADTTDDRIFVTGSIIKREESSQLVVTVDRSEIDLRAATNATEILAGVQANQHLTISNAVTAFFNPSAFNGANLRSLGDTSTLVLVDGKRVVRNPFRGTNVNLNTIPSALIESVDVLQDGASSIYGSDAIAGVINFRMREELQGLEYNFHTSQPTEGPGADLYNGSLAYGVGDLSRDGWNFYAGGSWRDKQELLPQDRPFLAAENSAERGQRVVPGRLEAFPPNVSQLSNGVVNQNPFPGCNPPFNLSDGNGGCYISRVGNRIKVHHPEEQKSFITSFTALLGEEELDLDYFRSWSRIDMVMNANRIPGNRDELSFMSPFFPGNGVIPAIPGVDPNEDVELPAGQPGFLVGRTNDVRQVTDRALASLSGDIFGGDYEVWGLRSESDITVGAVGYLDSIWDGFTGANGAPWINPFSLEQTPEAQAFIESNERRGPSTGAEGTFYAAGFTYGRDLFELPAGVVSSAVAYEFNDETLSFERFSEIADLFNTNEAGDAETTVDRHIHSVTGQVLVPVFDNVEIDASLRFDSYSDVGDTVNPKIQVSYDATEYLNFHGSYNTGFRAPTLYDVARPTSFSFTPETLSTIDPIRCPNGVAIFQEDIDDPTNGNFGCRGQYATILGGNPDLQPEESRAFAVGADLTLGDDALFGGALTIGVDYWNYKLTEVIGTINSAAIFDNLDEFGSQVIRCSQLGSLDLPGVTLQDLLDNSSGCISVNGPDRIGFIEQFLQNLGEVKTAGMDFEAHWDTETGIGDIALDYRGTKVFKYDFQRFEGDGFNSRLNDYFDGFPVFGYKHYLTGTWTSGPWSAQVQHTFQSGYEDCNAQCGIAPEFFNHVDAYGLWGIVGTYEFSESLIVSLHVRNVFDKDPPFTNGNGRTWCARCDLRLQDVIGRQVGVTIRGSLSDPLAWLFN